MIDIQSAIADNRRRKKQERNKKEEETAAAKYNVLYWAAIAITKA